MEWEALTWNGSSLHSYSSELYQWADVPDRIVRVEVQTEYGSIRMLQGMDNYYVLPSGVYGMFNDPQNFQIYDGLQHVAYRVEGRVEVQLVAELSAEILEAAKAGVMIPDEVARSIGLL